MKNLLIVKFDSLAVSIISIVYGLNIVAFPDLINYEKVYGDLNKIFNSYTFAVIFISLGLLKIVGMLINSPKLRAFAISGLISIWTLFLVSVLISGVVNSIWILPFAMVIFSSGVVIQEWFH